MTERDADQRWHLTLEQIAEVNQSYHTLVRMVQHGLGSLSGEVAEARRDIITLQNENADVRRGIQECFVRLGRLEADGAARLALIRYLLLLTTAIVLVLLVSFVWQIVIGVGG